MLVAKKKPISIKAAEAMRVAAIERTPDLCKTLCGIAAFHVEDKRAQKKIYESILILQILANLPPMPAKE